jgi:hypothetical protein
MKPSSSPTQWKLTDELYAALHRWPSLVALFLGGALIGWMITLIWPSPFQAKAHIYVALNPYRTYEDTQFQAMVNPEYSNIDNYKNWQMSQLQGAIFLDDFIEATLERLQEQDDYWKDYDAARLGGMFDTYWRTAGKWTLVVQGGEAQRMEQAVQAWSVVSVEKVKEATLAARDTVIVDEELQEVSKTKAQAVTRRDDLLAAQASLESWIQKARQMDGDTPLEMTERWQVLSMATRMAEINPGGQSLLDGQPPVGATRQAYLDWAALITTYMQGEISQLEERIDTLEGRRQALAERFSTLQEQSLGLSPNLEIDKLEYQPAETRRTPALLILVGGVMGALVWVYLQLARITNQEPDRE